MDALLSLVPGGSLTAIIGGLVGLLLAAWRIFAAGKASERSKQQANRLESIEKARDIDADIAARDSVENRKELGKWSG